MDGSTWSTLVPFAEALLSESRGSWPPRRDPVRDLPPLEPGLMEALARLARTPVLLVGSDFDGTLAPLVPDPARAHGDPVALASLRALAAMPGTEVAIISGRSLADLRTRVPADVPARLVGAHGNEPADVAPAPMDADDVRALALATEALEALAARHPGAWVERKPRGVAFHVRRLGAQHAPGALAEADAIAAGQTRLARRDGSMVMELLVDRAGKGEALARARRRAGATAVLFVGDDPTDEHALATLSGEDLGIRVGEAATVAPHRVATVSHVAAALLHLAHARAEHLRQRRLTPINAHSVLSDQRTIAVMDARGGIVWLCVPRLDDPALFASLLGDASAGSFEIGPMDPGEADAPTQVYDGDTMILRTSWPGLTVTDYLDCGHGRAFQRAGRSDLIRVIRADRPTLVRFAPRLDFGRTPTRLLVHPEGVEVEGGADPILLHAPGVRWSVIEEGPHQTAVAEIAPSAEAIVLELRAGSSGRRAHPSPEPARQEATRRFWSAWAASLRVPGVAPGLVRRSALMLRALVHGPTGAIAAAATTSLPEHLGGQRNWDYRYCWPRDAAMAAASLVRLGNTGVAMRFLDWITRVVDQCESPERLRPIYTVEGLHLASEAELGHLRGYGESRPVRIGNAAAQQVQLDVFGPIADLVARLCELGAPIAPDHWRMTRAMVEAVAGRWTEPDHGIWEIRGPRRHHLHTKAMCFHTVDRALVVQEHTSGQSNPAWIELRERIREDILRCGCEPSTGAFGTAYGVPDADAASLAVGLVGVVPMDDPRFVATVDLVRERLTSAHAVRRYGFDDGLPGPEGAFHLCTAWLIEALVRRGRVDEARAHFEAMRRAVGPTGILAEQHDPEHDIALGNIPQAYSHLALINSAVLLHEVGVRDEAGGTT